MSHFTLLLLDNKNMCLRCDKVNIVTTCTTIKKSHATPFLTNVNATKPCGLSLSHAYLMAFLYSQHFPQYGMYMNYKPNLIFNI